MNKGCIYKTKDLGSEKYLKYIGVKKGGHTFSVVDEKGRKKQNKHHTIITKPLMDRLINDGTLTLKSCPKRK